MIVMKLAIILEALGGFSIASKGAFPGVARTRTATTLSMSLRPHHRPRPATSSFSCCARQKRVGLSPNRLRLGQDQCVPTERTSAFLLFHAPTWIGPASDAPGGVGKPFFANDQIDERNKGKKTQGGPRLSARMSGTHLIILTMSGSNVGPSEPLHRVWASQPILV